MIFACLLLFQGCSSVSNGGTRAPNDVPSSAPNDVPSEIGSLNAMSGMASIGTGVPRVFEVSPGGIAGFDDGVVGTSVSDLLEPRSQQGDAAEIDILSIDPVSQFEPSASPLGTRTLTSTIETTNVPETLTHEIAKMHRREWMERVRIGV